MPYKNMSQKTAVLLCAKNKTTNSYAILVLKEHTNTK
jgi:hypothetical protein